ncbi:hypothetical protein [Actinoplanes rectilineatus]|uniref:hypothetical protein n=1 Tax=Actinoplanes rectilineatus TaxID=113571 RepID=UPI0005F28B97|nr:hypothetical protein [Actinoplanes rectilineatus]
MIRSLLYAIICDLCGAEFKQRGANQFLLEDTARQSGWWFRRRKDGQYARRGGKDYCPSCARTAGFTVAGGDAR